MQPFTSIAQLLEFAPIFTNESHDAFTFGNAVEDANVRLSVNDVQGNFRFFVFPTLAEAQVFRIGLDYNADGDQFSSASQMSDGRGLVIAMDTDADWDWMLFDFSDGQFEDREHVEILD
jgi:hypothetical protein